MNPLLYVLAATVAFNLAAAETSPIRLFVGRSAIPADGFTMTDTWDLRDRERIVLRCLSETSAQANLIFRSGTGSFQRAFDLTPGEQFVIIPTSAFARVDEPAGWGDITDANLSLAEATASVTVLELNATAEGAELPPDQLCLVAPISPLRQVAAAWPLRAILDLSTYPERVENAGRTLSENLKILTGKQLPVNPKGLAPSPGSRNVILIGAEAVTKAGLVTEAELDAQGFNGLVVKSHDSCLAIAGQSVQGTNYGVYKLLERQGLKYVAAGVYAADAVRPGHLIVANFVDKPFFRGKRITTSYCIYGDSSSTFALADPRTSNIDKEYPCDKTLWIDHTAAFLVPKTIYLADHPEYYVQKPDGSCLVTPETPDVRVLVCPTNPGGIQVAAQRLLSWIKAQADRHLFVVQQGDSMDPCYCPTCRHKREQEGWNESDLMLNWTNAIARQVLDTYPDKRLLCYAYVDTQPAPRVLKPEPNVQVLYCPWPTAISAPNGFRDFDAPENAVAGQQLRDWLDVAGENLGDYDYNSGFVLSHRGMAARIKWLARHHARAGFWYSGVNHTFQPMFEYVHSQLNWDPFQDTGQLEREFIRTYYGDNAPLVEELVSSIYNRLEAVKCVARVPPPDYFATDFVDHILALFDEAISRESGRRQTELQHDKANFLLNGLLALQPAGHEIDDDELRRFGSMLKPYLAGKLEEIRLTAERQKKPLTEASYQPLSEQIWNWTRVEVPASPAGEDAVPQRLQEMLESPFETIRSYRITRFDKPLPGGGVLIPAMSFSGACGPTWYKWKCEGKVAAWVRGAMTDVSTMAADFTLEAQPQGRAVLELDGQDSDSLWAPPAPIRISINGTEVFSGVPGFVKCGWARRQFQLPAGLLQQGENRLTIHNLVNSDSPRVHWVMISEASITFPGD